MYAVVSRITRETSSPALHLTFGLIFCQNAVDLAAGSIQTLQRCAPLFGRAMPCYLHDTSLERHRAPVQRVQIEIGAGVVPTTAGSTTTALPVLFQQTATGVGDSVDALPFDRLARHTAFILQELKRWVDRARTGTVEPGIALFQHLDQLVAMTRLLGNQFQQDIFEIAASVPPSATAVVIEWIAAERPAWSPAPERPAWPAWPEWSPAPEPALKRSASAWPEPKGRAASKWPRWSSSWTRPMLPKRSVWSCMMTLAVHEPILRHWLIHMRRPVPPSKTMLPKHDRSSLR